MKYRLIYSHQATHKDIPALSQKQKVIIKKAIDTKLLTRPEIFGKPLRKSLKHFRSLRVGDYRVLFRIEENTIEILTIQHRSVAYQNAEKMLVL